MIENSVDYGFIKIDLVKPFESVKPCPSFFTCKPSILLLYVKLGRGLRLQTLLDNFVDVLRFILKKIKTIKIFILYSRENKNFNVWINWWTILFEKNTTVEGQAVHCTTVSQLRWNRSGLCHAGPSHSPGCGEDALWLPGQNRSGEMLGENENNWKKLDNSKVQVRLV